MFQRRRRASLKASDRHQMLGQACGSTSIHPFNHPVSKKLLPSSLPANQPSCPISHLAYPTQIKSLAQLFNILNNHRVN